MKVSPGRSFVVLFISLLTFSCKKTSDQSSYVHITDHAVQTILKRAILTAGGLDHFSSINRISYTKRSVLYLEDGTIESDMVQKHAYTLKPQLRGVIKWTKPNTEMRIVYDPGGIFREENGKQVDSSEESARQVFMSAYYVLFMPFKLLDPGAILSYEGTDTLDSGQIVDVIRANYDPGEYENHSTSDIWWFYFDKEDGSYLASMVYHKPTYAYIENNKTTDEHEIRFNTYRESYRTDSLRNKKYLRGVFYYSDFELNTN